MYVVRLYVMDVGKSCLVLKVMKEISLIISSLLRALDKTYIYIYNNHFSPARDQPFTPHLVRRASRITQILRQHRPRIKFRRRRVSFRSKSRRTAHTHTHSSLLPSFPFILFCFVRLCVRRVSLCFFCMLAIRRSGMLVMLMGSALVHSLCLVLHSGARAYNFLRGVLMVGIVAFCERTPFPHRSHHLFRKVYCISRRPSSLRILVYSTQTPVRQIFHLCWGRFGARAMAPEKRSVYTRHGRAYQGVDEGIFADINYAPGVSVCVCVSECYWVSGKIYDSGCFGGGFCLI